MPEGHQPAQIPPLHEGTLAPDDVARRSFSTTFRGYDQHEVRGFLTRVAAEVRMLLDRERELRRRIEVMEQHRPLPPPAAEPDEQQMIAALGTEAGRVIQAAREAAVEIRSKAEEHVGRLVREAQDEASRVRNEAEQLLDIRTAEAENAAEAIRNEAAQEAEVELERARARGREMVAEAQAVRERLLRDLARRRRTAHGQIEQLRAGRDRLLEAYRVVRQTLEEATAELSRAEPEARAAAESAALRAAGEPEPTVEEMEAELVTARENDLGPVFAPEPLPGEAADPPAPAIEVAEPPAAAVETAEPASQVAEPAGGGAEPPAAPGGGERTEHETRPAATGVPAGAGGEGEPTPAPGARAGAYEEVPTEERRSSLRLLRRRRAEHGAPEGEVHVVEPGDAVEGVRVLRPPPEPAPAEPAPAEPAGTAAPPADEAAPEPSAADQAEDEPTGEAGDVAAEHDERRPARVEELFARIRAERAESVAHAEEVLARPDADAGAGDAGDPHDTGATGEDPSLASRPEGSANGDQPGTDGGERRTGGADEALLEQRDNRIEPLERQATRALKRALSDEQNEVLDRLRRHAGPPTLDALLGAAAEHGERYAGAVRAALVEAAAAGAGFGGDEAVGAGVDVTDLAADAAGELAAGLRDRVGRLVEDAGDGGEQAVTARLSSVYRELKTQRAETLVRDAVLAAFNRGVYAAVPDGARVRWVVDFDGKPCPDGDDNALAGVIAKGEAFPTGQCLPPAHAGCRCVLVPHTL